MERMNYLRGGVKGASGKTRMEPLSEITIGQLLALPNGTEMLVIDIAPLGVGLSQTIRIIDSDFKEGLMSPDSHAECDHSMSPHNLEQMLFPGSVFIILAPEDYEPSVDELMYEKFVRQGVREGREGAPMYSETGLKSRYSTEEWSEGSYEAYVSAYKRGSESRKGR